jgi:hypothetical protein
LARDLRIAYGPRQAKGKILLRGPGGGRTKLPSKNEFEVFNLVFGCAFQMQKVRIIYSTEFTTI